MPSLRDIKRRIKSVKNTQQITKAMKMVSAAKLRRAQEDMVAARPYAEKMVELISSLVAKTKPESHALLAGREGNKTGVITITSDRGLCGSFNTVLIRTVESFIAELEGEPAGLFVIGRRGGEYFKRRDFNLFSSVPFGGARPKYSTAALMAADVIGRYLSNELDKVYIIYSEFKSALTQRPVALKLLPIAPEKPSERPEDAAEEAATATTEPDIKIIYEPTADVVLKNLLPKYVEVLIYRALLESSASEHGARMTSMDSASKNASEMIGGLTLKYNRLRQAAITRELVEIISGAETLKS